MITKKAVIVTLGPDDELIVRTCAGELTIEAFARNDENGPTDFVATLKTDRAELSLETMTSTREVEVHVATRNAIDIAFGNYTAGSSIYPDDEEGITSLKLRNHAN